MMPIYQSINENLYYTGLNLLQSTCQFHPQSCIKGRQIPGIDLEGASNIEMCEKYMDSPVMGSIFSLTESNSPNFPKYSWAERHLLHWIGRPDTRISHQLICHLKLKWTCKSSWEASWGNPPTKSFLSSSSPILNLISEINRNSVQNWTNVYMFQMYLCCRHFDYIYKIFWLSQTNRALQFSITWYHSILQFEPSQIFRKNRSKMLDKWKLVDLDYKI